MMYSGLPGDPGGIVANPGAGSFTVIAINVYLDGVADLTHPAEADIIQTNAQELTGDWHWYKHRPLTHGCASATHTGMAPTQELGEALFNNGFKGFLTFSAVEPRYKNLAVFMERLLAPDDSLVYSYEDDTGLTQVISAP